ncbi:class I SAM-dependent methyltransferase [Calidifontibacillus oryziterrae]|uniref:class I SAM-dependent methyltransferase n=1 Tax=Calidifontibacillus oryziterrae TaxID=1191699 RepID=UPI0002F92210|nr:class I SAM-dependent methyltransferase [Calidifontibacillus oryziterrae]
MIVTTGGRTNHHMIEIAKRVAEELQILYLERKKVSIEKIITAVQDDVLVVGKNRLVIYPLKDPSNPIFFHPNSAMFRVKRIVRGEEDPFIQATKLKKGTSFLDCTIGLASDSIVASSVIGPTGRVVGIEGNRYIAYLLSIGLQTWESGHEPINQAMRQITIIQADHLTFLQQQTSASFDVVYFDPMFEENIVESDGIKGLRSMAIYEDLVDEAIEQALRVAKARVVLKDHWKSARFERFGFTVYRRKTAKFHFGVIEKFCN